MKKMRMLVILLSNMKCKFWSQDGKPTLFFIHTAIAQDCAERIIYNTSHAPSYCVEYSTMEITIALIFGFLFTVVQTSEWHPH